MTVTMEIETTTETLTATVPCIRIPRRQGFFMHLSFCLVRCVPDTILELLL